MSFQEVMKSDVSFHGNGFWLRISNRGCHGDRAWLTTSCCGCYGDFFELTTSKTRKLSDK